MKKSQKKLSLKRIVKLANEALNPDTSTIEGLKQHITNWYCFKYNVTFKDPILLSHTFEELLVLYYMHRIVENPESVEEILNPQMETYEDWIRKQMGEDYITEEQMVQDMLEYDRQEKELAETLPDNLNIDFNNPEE